MARQSVLDLILNIRKQGTGAKQSEDELRRLKDASGEAGKAAERLSLGWTAVQGALVTAGVAFLRSVPAMVQQGEAINRANTALEAYAGGALQAEMATEAILDATNNAISEFDAVHNATKFFSMGLAETSEEAGKLAEIAVTMGAAVGKDAKSSFEEFSLLLANQSIQRLDQFGLSAGQVRLRIQELMDANAGLTRQQAFTNAVLEIGGEKLQQLDKAGFQATSSIERLTAHFENINNSAATFFADGLLPIVDTFYNMRDVVQEHSSDILMTSDSYDGYLERMREARRAHPLQVLGFLSVSEAVYEETRAREAAKEAIREQAGANEQLSDSYSELVLAQEEAKLQLDELSLLMKTDLSQSLETVQEKIKAQQDNISEWQARIQELNSQGYVTPEQQSEIDELNGKIDDATNNVKELEEQWDEQTKKMIFNIAQQSLAMDGFTQEELDALARLAGPEGFGLVDEAGAEMISRIGEASLAMAETGDQSGLFVDDMRDLQGAVGDASTDVGGLRDNINSLPTSKTVTLTTNSVHNKYINTYSSYNVQDIQGGDYQHGGEIEVGGLPGPDRVPVAFNASRGEKITITPRGGVTPAEKGGGNTSGRPINVQVYNRFDLSLLEQVLRGR